MKVELVDFLGSDLTVVNAARVSFSKESDWDYIHEELEGGVTKTTRTLKQSDRKLIGYLARHNHFTPFTHAVITVRETVPIFVARQRFKHTVGFSYNEVSRRYVDDDPEFYTPAYWRKRADSVKQGSSDEPINEFEFDYADIGWTRISKEYAIFIEYVEALYKSLINSNVAPEQARMVLPQSMYTSYYVTGSLAAFARAYKLRSDSHAQREIQELADSWDAVIRPLYPCSWTALTDPPSTVS